MHSRRVGTAAVESEGYDTDDYAPRARVGPKGGRGWKQYLMVVLMGFMLIFMGVKVYGGDGGGGGILKNIDLPGCSLFMSYGPYGMANQVVSYARHWGCHVYLGNPWSDADSLRVVTHQLIDASPELSSRKNFSSLREVDIVEGDSLEAEDFVEKYAVKNTPVVFRGLRAAPGGEWGSTSFWSEKCGGQTVTPVMYNKAKKNAWAGMEPHPNGSVTLGEFINGVEGNKQGYVHDWSLVANCPGVLDDFEVPKYFRNDFLQMGSHVSKYRDEWPSLFIGPKMSETGVHVDNLGSHAWLLQLQGRKHWRIVSEEQSGLMYSTPFSYEVDLFETDWTKHKMAKLLNVQEIETHPGDIIFVPAGALHQVKNLDTSVAITSNYIDHTCLKQALRALSEISTVDEAVYYLTKELKSKHDDGTLPTTWPPEPLPWAAFKSQRFEREAVLHILDHPDTEKYIIIALSTVSVFVAASAYILYQDLGMF